MTVGQCAPGLTALGEARGAGYDVFQVLDRKPVIDSASQEGDKPPVVDGRLELREVTHQTVFVVFCIPAPRLVVRYVKVYPLLEIKRVYPFYRYTLARVLP